VVTRGTCNRQKESSEKYSSSDKENCPSGEDRKEIRRAREVGELEVNLETRPWTLSRALGLRPRRPGVQSPPGLSKRGPPPDEVCSRGSRFDGSSIGPDGGVQDGRLRPAREEGKRVRRLPAGKTPPSPKGSGFLARGASRRNPVARWRPTAPRAYCKSNLLREGRPSDASAAIGRGRSRRLSLGPACVMVKPSHPLRLNSTEGATIAGLSACGKNLIQVRPRVAAAHTYSRCSA
jgi:hypothetical protein